MSPSHHQAREERRAWRLTAPTKPFPRSRWSDALADLVFGAIVAGFALAILLGWL
jgi:cytochrome b561